MDSSSGESDSSASSRESTSSGNSDMVIIERTMSGMYRVLDGWIKNTLPVLPEQNLQDSLLHILQEQDDVLIEGLLCLLDTHTSLYAAGRPGPDTVTNHWKSEFSKKNMFYLSGPPRHKSNKRIPPSCEHCCQRFKCTARFPSFERDLFLTLFSTLSKICK